MRRALDLAERGRGLTSPNPCVGAVLVRGEKIVGEGWHRRAGTAHAEVLAVRAAHRAGHRIAGTTLYVTLEPCCTEGRTPACTDLIRREKISRVVVAATDPNPHHAGRAYRLLRQQGITVTTGILRREATELNRAFNHWIVHRTPWVVGKIAMSLDGSIAPQKGESPWLTGLSARRYAHQIRLESDAILIGGETARQDDPALTIRMVPSRGKEQPWRVVWTRSGKLPPSLQLFTDAHRDRTLVMREKSLPDILTELGNRGVTQLLIEGGGQVLGSSIAQGLVHEVAFFIAPVLLGTQVPPLACPLPQGAVRLKNPHYVQLGQDILCRGIL